MSNIADDIASAYNEGFNDGIKSLLEKSKENNDAIKGLECLHKRILQSKFAEEVTEIEIIGLVYAPDLINRQKEDIDRLTVELQAMRGAANSYKMHYEDAQAEIEELKKKMTQEGDTTDA